MPPTVKNLWLSVYKYIYYFSTDIWLLMATNKTYFHISQTTAKKEAPALLSSLH